MAEAVAQREKDLVKVDDDARGRRVIIRKCRQNLYSLLCIEAFYSNGVTAVLTSPKSSVSNNNEEFQKAKSCTSIIINASNTRPKKM